MEERREIKGGGGEALEASSSPYLRMERLKSLCELNVQKYTSHRVANHIRTDRLRRKIHISPMIMRYAEPPFSIHHNKLHGQFIRLNGLLARISSRPPLLQCRLFCPAK